MATKFTQPEQGQLRLVEPSPPVGDAPELTAEEARDVHLLLKAGYTREAALEEILGPYATDATEATEATVELTLVESPPTPDPTVVEIDRETPDGAGTNAYMDRARQGQ